MKHFITLAFIIFFFGKNYSQDIIIKRNGDEIKAKVIEITNTLVKYKKHSNLSGPIYNIEKKNILMIRYQNGEKDIFETTKTKQIANTMKLDMDGGYFKGNTPISKKEFKKILFTNPKAKKMFKSANLVIATGALSEFAGLLMITPQPHTNKKSNANEIVFGAILTLSGIYSIFEGAKLKKKAVKIYNDNINNKLNISLNLGFNKVGVVINF